MVNKPLDRLVIRYMSFCRRHGIYVEEENLRLRWLADAPMYIAVVGTFIGYMIIYLYPYGHLLYLNVSGYVVAHTPS